MKKANIVLIAIFSTIIIGCGKKSESEIKAEFVKKVEVDIKAEFLTKLSDPSSLQMEKLVSYSDETVCGLFNSKNKMGGYVGFRKFIYNSKGVMSNAQEFYSDARLSSEAYSPLTAPKEKLIYDSSEGGSGISTDEVWCKDGDHGKKYIGLMETSADKMLSLNTEEQVKKYEASCVEAKERVDKNDAKFEKLQKADSDLGLRISNLAAGLNLSLARNIECSLSEESRKKRDWALKDKDYAASIKKI